MENTTKQAVKAFCRLLQPIENEHAEGAEMDAMFDGSEFSGPAHDRMFEVKADALAERVANRFGMNARELWNEYQRYYYEESRRMYEQLDYRKEL